MGAEADEPAGAAEAEFTPGSGETEFEAAMRDNAKFSDTDGDNKLSFEEFSAFIRDREEGEFTEEELRKRFAELDKDGSGQVDMHEYLQWSLRDALSRSSQRIVDLFRMWDEDKSGTVDKKEFFKALRALGFKVEQEDTDLVFDNLDSDRSGTLEYAELNEKLSAGEGGQLTKRNLKRAPSQAYRGRDAKVTTKNVNVNYAVAHAAVLPETVKLDSTSDRLIQEQLRDIIKEHKVKLIDLFREWDDDGNGGLDKKEFRRAIAALGFDVPKFEMDAIYDTMDADGNNFIEFDELKKALSDKVIAETKAARDEQGSQDAFNSEMRHNAADRNAADVDDDNKLSFEEFCGFICDREEGEFTEEELRKRFSIFDADGTGKVDMHEYLQWSLRDALARSSSRLVDLFRMWDEDKSGTVDKKEFSKAVRALGFEIDKEDLEIVFDSLDADGSGALEYAELHEKLSAGFGADLAKRNLKRAPKQAYRGRDAKVTRKNINVNYVVAHVAVLPETVKLSAQSDQLMQEQLRDILKSNQVKLIDLFREWDDNGDGGLDKKEFRRGVQGLGYDAPAKAIDAVFDEMNDDKNGFIEFHELKKGLSDKAIAEVKKSASEVAGTKRPSIAKRKSTLEDGTPGTGEEEFEVGMRKNAADRAAADGDDDKKLSYEEFCTFIRDREEGEFTEEELRKRFSVFDADGTGKIDMHEYLQWSLRDALARSSSRLVDLFRMWDEDKSGTVDKKEFSKAVRALGFEIDKEDLEIVFDSLDADGSGALEYAELHEKLSAGFGADLAKRNLKRAPKQAYRGRDAKVTRKNINVNYLVAHVAVLPETVKLSAESDQLMQEQLRDILKSNQVKLIDLFREWDDNGDGGLDKKEFRRGVQGLGYDAPAKAIDAVFDEMNDDKNGFIEFHELKKGLSDKAIAEAKREKAPSIFKRKSTLEGDTPGTGEEEFEVGMRKNATDHDVADVDDDKKLSYEEFCTFIRDREEGEFTEEELRKRFSVFDADGTGKIDMHEYLQWSLRDALARSSSRLVDLFRMWDEDKSGTVDKKEFSKAVRALGFPIEQDDSDIVFDSLDVDKSGTLEYAELHEKLSAGFGADLAKRNLKRAPKQAYRGRDAKVTTKNINVNYVVAHAAVLPETVKLDSTSDLLVQEQLRDILKENHVTLIDLFREWDDNGDGGLDKKEFRLGVQGLGYDAPAKAIDAVFDQINGDGNGFVEFHELKKGLSDSVLKESKRMSMRDESSPTRKSLKQIKRMSSKNVLEGDTPGTGEEEFDVGMRKNAADRDAADEDDDDRLSFAEFTVFIRDREEGEFTEEELRKRFEMFDIDKNDMIDMKEYLLWSLRDALARSSQRLIDVFRMWDDDKSGTIDKREFFKAVRAVGFDIAEEDANMVFRSLDADRSGSLEYAELHERLRSGHGSELAKRNLKRAPKQAYRGRDAEVTRKNINVNYAVAHAACLPETVKLSADSDQIIQEQLRDILKQHHVKLIDLFREWDDNGDGGLNKKEFRRGVQGMGYSAPINVIDQVYDDINGDGNGFVEFHELKKALTDKAIAEAKRAARRSADEASGKRISLKRNSTLTGDEAGTGEEEFAEGMSKNAADRDAADVDDDSKLSFEEFCGFIRDREEGEFTEEELRKRFSVFDADSSGKIDMAEYLQWSLRDALARSSQRLIDVFRMWDEDKSGTVDKKEFFKAVRAVGFKFDQEDSDFVFDSLDADRSGSLEYAELHEKLRSGVGAGLTKRNLKRAPKQAYRGRDAKVTTKNINVNYVVAHAAVLPETVKLDSTSDLLVQEQLRDILKENHVKLIDLFREWDDNGDGGLDKKEFRRGVQGLGYDAPAKAIDAVFNEINGDGNGFVEFEELKKGLSESAIAESKRVSMQGDESPTKRGKQKSIAEIKRMSSKNVLEGDTPGTGEEGFDVGMRKNAADRDAADDNDDNKLSFEEFCVFIRAREEGEFTEEELRKRFNVFDIDESGKIDMKEYLQWSLRDALARSSSRLIDIFRMWDDDKSGTIDKREFFKAVRAVGFDIAEEDANMVFDNLDADRSGSLEYAELHEKLRKGHGAELAKRNLKRAPKQAYRGRDAEVTRKNNSFNYVVAHAACLPETVKLVPGIGISVQEQLRDILKENQVKLIDLFREWDDNGDGGLDKKEFRRGVQGMGYDAPPKEIDAIFSDINDDGNGFVEFHELKKALNDKRIKEVQDAADAAALAAGKVLPSVLRKQLAPAAAPVGTPRSLPPLSDDNRAKQMQLSTFLAMNNIKVIELFREWDEDGNNALDKNELRRAVKALGYYAPGDVCDALFDSIDESGDGLIDFDEMKRALNQFLKGRLPSPKRMRSQPSMPSRHPLATRSPMLPLLALSCSLRLSDSDHLRGEGGGSACEDAAL